MTKDRKKRRLCAMVGMGVALVAAHAAAAEPNEAPDTIGVPDSASATAAEHPVTRTSVAPTEGAPSPPPIERRGTHAMRGRRPTWLPVAMRRQTSRSTLW